MIEIEQDENGTWEVTQEAKCRVRLLTKPSQAFLDWQASNPIYVEEPVRDLPAEIDNLEARIAKLEVSQAKLE